MADITELKRRAAECLNHARQAKDEHSRLAWLEMAQYWQRHAEEAEANTQVFSKDAGDHDDESH